IGVPAQSWIWAAGFFLLSVMIAICGLSVIRPASTQALAVPNKVNEPRAVTASAITSKPAIRRPNQGPDGASAVEAAQPITWPQRLRWLALAFVPSSLMLGVTTYIVTDIASVPLFWIIPLALYLFTFIVAFPPLPGGKHLPASLLSLLRL